MTDTFAKLLASTHINKGGYKRLAFLMILFFWATHKYSTGDKLLGMLVLLCLVLVLLRIPYLIPISVAAVMFALFHASVMEIGVFWKTPNRLLQIFFHLGQVNLFYLVRLGLL